MKIKSWFALTIVSLFACSSPRPFSFPPTAPACDSSGQTFGWSESEEMGVNPGKLLELTQWVQSNGKLPIFSIVISKNNRIVYELYTSNIQRDDAHYMMSVTM